MMSTTQSQLIERLAAENKSLQLENDQLYKQVMAVCTDNETLRISVDALRQQVEQERALFARLTLLEPPPSSDDTQHDLPAAAGG
jgi:regulator of replication initiation timing